MKPGLVHMALVLVTLSLTEKFNEASLEKANVGENMTSHQHQRWPLHGLDPDNNDKPKYVYM